MAKAEDIAHSMVEAPTNRYTWGRSPASARDSQLALPDGLPCGSQARLTKPQRHNRKFLLLSLLLSFISVHFLVGPASVLTLTTIRSLSSLPRYLYNGAT